MSTKENENWGTKELVHYLSQSNEALRVENSRLLDEVERLTNNIDVIDAEIVSNQMNHYYQFMNNFNYTLKKQ
jgi:hypothetical protein